MIVARQTCRQPEMRSSFNQLLVNLSLLDTLFLAMSTWDYSAVKVFHYEPQVRKDFLELAMGTKFFLC